MTASFPIRVLVVDDEENVRANLRVFLEDEGFRVLSAASGEEALQVLGCEPVELGIIDIRLPGMDGSAFILHARAAYPPMHFLIHTGSPNYKLPDELAELGLDPGDVFLKPVMDMSAIVRAIHQKLVR